MINPPAHPHVDEWQNPTTGYQAYNRNRIHLRGIDISHIDPTQTLDQAAINISGGYNHFIEDIRGDARHQLADGIWLDATNSQIRRVAINRARRFGIILKRGGRLIDAQTGHTRDTTNQDGTAEQGIHLEGRCLVWRVFDRASRIGILTTRMSGTLTDIDVGLNDIAGIYAELETHDLTIDRCRITKSRVGIQSEPARDGYTSGPITIRNTHIVSGWHDQSAEHYGYGVWCSPGSGPVTLENVTITGQHGWALPHGSTVHNVDTSGCTGTRERWL